MTTPNIEGTGNDRQMDAVGGQEPVEGASNNVFGSCDVLLSSISALLGLDACDALVPHGIGGHARTLLTASADALQSQAERIAELEDDVKYLQEDINAMCNAIPDYRWSGGAAKLIAECFAERDELRAELADMAVNIATYEHLVGLANDTATRLLKERDTLRAEIAAIAATEPSMIYHGRCIIDCGDSGHQDVTMLKMIARETKLFTHPMPAESKDAERYRWLRDYLISPSTHFDDLIVSADKADTLDGVIDAARAKGAKQ